MSTRTARRNFPMPIRCSGHRIRSSATARADAFLEEGWNFGMRMNRIGSIVVAMSLLLPGRAVAMQLITEDEAKLPPPKGAIAADRRGILRGPKVDFISPGDTVHSPLHLQLKFEAFGGAKIDPDSVKMTFLRTPNVDLTPRIKPF